MSQWDDYMDKYFVLKTANEIFFSKKMKIVNKKVAGNYQNKPKLG